MGQGGRITRVAAVWEWKLCHNLYRQEIKELRKLAERLSQQSHFQRQYCQTEINQNRGESWLARPTESGQLDVLEPCCNQSGSRGTSSIPPAPGSSGSSQRSSPTSDVSSGFRPPLASPLPERDREPRSRPHSGVTSRNGKNRTLRAIRMAARGQQQPFSPQSCSVQLRHTLA